GLGHMDWAPRRNATGGRGGSPNFETAVCSAKDLPFGDGALDSISVRSDVCSLPTSPSDRRVRACRYHLSGMSATWQACTFARGVSGPCPALYQFGESAYADQAHQILW